MPKEKTKTQSRKKQETDVSDALFHVTPQPTIDIFEVLGGAINVQTAAFLTGKVDSLNAPIPNPSEDISDATPPRIPSDSVPTPSVHANTITPTIEPTSTEPPVEPLTTTAPVQPEDMPQALSEGTLSGETLSLETPSSAASSAPDQSAAVRLTDEETPHPTHTPSILESTLLATSPAISHTNSHSTATSTDCRDHENSTAISSHDTSPASPSTSHHATHNASTHSTPRDSIDNSTPRTPHSYVENSIASSTAPSTATHPQIAGQYDEMSPFYGTQNIPQSASIQGPSLLQQLTKREEELLQFLRHHHGQIVSYSQMLKALNWRESQRCTARNIIARFEANGIIQRQRIQGTRSQGYLFTMCEYTSPKAHIGPQENPYYQNPMTPYSGGHSTQNSIAPYAQTMPLPNARTSIATSTNYSTHTIPQTSTPSYIDKIDKLIQSIWQSDQETISACWPAVAAAGFRSAHLRQLQSIFELQGFEPDTVPLGLRYLDWQLEQGPLTNARGEIIEDPVAYWLSSMRRHGYYSRPKGYIDPLLEAKRLLAEEEQTKLELQTQLDQARQQNESAAEEKRCELLFAELMEQGVSHPLWESFYQRLPQMFRSKVDAEGPEALAKKFGMVKALLKDFAN